VHFGSYFRPPRSTTRRIDVGRRWSGTGVEAELVIRAEFSAPHGGSARTLRLRFGSVGSGGPSSVNGAFPSRLERSLPGSGPSRSRMTSSGATLLGADRTATGGRWRSNVLGEGERSPPDCHEVRPRGGGVVTDRRERGIEGRRGWGAVQGEGPALGERRVDEQVAARLRYRHENFGDEKLRAFSGVLAGGRRPNASASRRRVDRVEGTGGFADRRP